MANIKDIDFDGVRYFNSKLSLDFYKKFLSEDEADDLFNYLEHNINWSKKITPGRRINQTFGDDGLTYIIKIHDKIIKRETKKWDPIIAAIRDRVSIYTGEAYNICVVQRYPNGNVGINPHKDKEMVKDTTISGVSLGTTRTLSMNYKDMEIKLKLDPGSLYVMNSPTNDFYTHSIEKDNTKTPRISLTFRNYM